MQKKSPSKPVLLVVLDGWGISPVTEGNAIALADTPYYDSIWNANPHTTLRASGEAVGLPAGKTGNSEIGHINMGAGSVVYQDLLRVNREIADGSFFQNKALKRMVDHVKQSNSSLHIMGLLSSAVVHSSVEHLYALLRFAKEEGLQRVYIHVFTDGRDSSPTAAPMFLSDLLQKIQTIGVGSVASIIGRYYAMDRDLRWHRTQQAYELLVHGKGKLASDPIQAVNDSYQLGETDEFIKPIIMVGESNQMPTIKDNDAVVFFNFRTDRPRQLTKAFVMPVFTEFNRGDRLKNLFFATMSEYEESLPVSAVAYDPPNIKFPLARVLADNRLKQLHLAESEKFPHVTYFFNGGHEDPFPGEDRIEVPSPKVSTYDKHPEMSAYAVTDILEERLREKLYDFIIVNYANADMVAHTANIDATIKAVEVLDECLKRIVTLTTRRGGAVLVTADHGNAEQMINPNTGEVDTEHNPSPVPFIYVGKNPDPRKIQSGVLADVAPTVLGLLNIKKSLTMSAKDLLS